MLVSEDALAKRLNRAMAEDGYRVRKTRGRWAGDWYNTGEWYIVDTTYNIVTYGNVDLEDLARENVLREWETVATEED